MKTSQDDVFNQGAKTESPGVNIGSEEIEVKEGTKEAVPKAGFRRRG